MEKIIESENGKYIIRPYKNEDESKVLSLWKTAFGREMHPSLWRWKYLENPYNEQILLCEDEKGQIAVLYGGIPYRANYKGETVEINQLMDIMSHPEYRKTGLFIKTAYAFLDYAGKEKGVLFLYGFPGEYHLRIGEKYLSYQAIRSGVRFLKIRVAALADIKTPELYRAGKIKEVAHTDESFDIVWKKCVKDYPLSIIRDAAFVQWRFFEHPFHTYEIWSYYFQGSPAGYAVFTVSGKTARMVDMLAPCSAEIINTFLAEIGKVYARKNIEFLETWLPSSHFLSHSLQTMGFQTAPEPFGFIPTGRLFENSLSGDWVSENLFYTMGDGDLL
ncbi:MAG: GNAT family N-acetyltransferase [Desulfococcaceae bacterium]|nr:GNAT family N-acetyltransferase [Desulfococcaceae bacterium]